MSTPNGEHMVKARVVFTHEYLLDIRADDPRWADLHLDESSQEVWLDHVADLASDQGNAFMALLTEHVDRSFVELEYRDE